MEPELWDALEVGGGREDRATPCDSAVWSDAADRPSRSLPGGAGLDEVYVPSLREPAHSGPLAPVLGWLTHAPAGSSPWRYPTRTAAEAS